MLILTTLKQKDLASVTAEQLFNHHAASPIQLTKYDAYSINGNLDTESLRHIIESSYIFSNPNKHHVILDATSPHLSQQATYVHIQRKTPLSLTSKITQLHALLGHCGIQHVMASTIWAFHAAIDAPTIMQNYVMSSKDNVAPLAHPLIHTVSHYSYDTLQSIFRT